MVIIVNHFATTWALVNCLCTIAVVIMSFLLIGFGIYRRIKYKYLTFDAERYIRVRSRIVFRLLSILVAIVAVVTFILTQNLCLTMVLIDKYTLWMIAFLVIQTHLVILSKSYYPIIEDF